MAGSTHEQIEKEIQKQKVVMFVKGTPEAPMCGFSAAAMKIFQDLKVPFHTVDVIANPELRRAVPEFSRWPTFPQIFIDGKLIGGSDILHEMRDSGELQKLLK